MDLLVDLFLTTAIVLLMVVILFILIGLFIEGSPVALYKAFLRSRTTYWTTVIHGTPAGVDFCVQDFLLHDLEIGKRGEVRAGCRFFFSFDKAIQHWEAVIEEFHSNYYVRREDIDVEYLRMHYIRYRRAHKFLEKLRELKAASKK